MFDTVMQIDSGSRAEGTTSLRFCTWKDREALRISRKDVCVWPCMAELVFQTWKTEEWVVKEVGFFHLLLKTVKMH